MKVSIITPSFNQGEFIERTLRSVSTQSGAEIEHVIFDGGSTDNTVAVLRAFSPPVRWVSEPDRGQTDAVNKGLAATDGEIIGWLNSDDVYYPGAVRSVLEFFQRHPDVDVVYGMADHIDKQDVPFESYPTEPWSHERLVETCFICQPALFFRRRVVERCGLLDASLQYCMDYEYWLRLAQAGVRFAYLERKLAGSRLYQENKTLGSAVKVHREINDMFLRTRGRVPDRWLFNYAHKLVERRISREEQPRRFVLSIGVEALKASLHWNRGISRSMLWAMVRMGLGFFSFLRCGCDLQKLKRFAKACARRS
jgi:Predicted glycosyltransferases